MAVPTTVTVSASTRTFSSLGETSQLTAIVTDQTGAPTADATVDEEGPCERHCVGLSCERVSGRSIGRDGGSSSQSVDQSGHRRVLEHPARVHDAADVPQPDVLIGGGIAARVWAQAPARITA